MELSPRPVRGISTLHYGTENDIPTAMMENRLLSYLPARFKEWDPGVTSCVSEKNTQQAEQIGYVRTVNTGQQGVETAVMGGQEDSCITKEMYQHKSVDKVYTPMGIMEKVIRMLIWDTGQLYKTEQVYCRASFRFSTGGEVWASTGTLVGRPPYLVRRAWGEVVPVGSSNQ